MIQLDIVHTSEISIAQSCHVWLGPRKNSPCPWLQLAHVMWILYWRMSYPLAMTSLPRRQGSCWCVLQAQNTALSARGWEAARFKLFLPTRGKLSKFSRSLTTASSSIISAISSSSHCRFAGQVIICFTDDKKWSRTRYSNEWMYL